jgi:AcrR family transcriptional regulator
MPRTASSLPAQSETALIRARILLQARSDFFAQGYNQFTMDALAGELGMSKKTLYVHFTGKDEIVSAVIDHLAAEIRSNADALLQNGKLNLAEKLRGFVEGMLARMASLTPRTVRDLQRFAPKLHAKVEEVRGTVLPYVFGRFVEEGQAAGLIRTNIPAKLAIEFFLHAMQGLMQPATLDRLRVAPSEVIAAGVDLFFSGLFTPAGRKQYEKQISR